MDIHTYIHTCLEPRENKIINPNFFCSQTLSWNAVGTDMILEFATSHGKKSIIGKYSTNVVLSNDRWTEVRHTAANGTNNPIDESSVITIRM